MNAQPFSTALICEANSIIKVVMQRNTPMARVTAEECLWCLANVADGASMLDEYRLIKNAIEEMEQGNPTVIHFLTPVPD